MMIMVNPATTTKVVTAVARPWRRSRFLCLASSVVNTQQLRSELDQLHSEADLARTKAKNARLRMMRLSEAAEKLQRQAAISVQAGRENYARDLLLQKKKIMQAMEKLKRRIELLDELSAKLIEAISVKESQLIGNVNLDIEVGQEASPTRICIAPSEPENYLTEDVDSYLNVGEDENCRVHSAGQCNDGSKFKTDEKSIVDENLQVDSGGQYNDGAKFETDKKSIIDENGILDNLRDISSYEEFLEHLDGQLSIIEAELAILIRLSALVLEREEMPRKSKVHQTLEILEGILGVRERIKKASQNFNASDVFLPSSH